MSLQYRVIHDTGGVKETRWVKDRDVTDIPCPAITCGIGGMNSCHFHIEIRDVPAVNAIITDKPPYAVPSMVKIAAIPWNGLQVVSTFSGCGGSCLGYRMAGFKVVWASEFVPAARDSYRANMVEDCILDGRDIRQVQPEEIIEATGIGKGDLDLLDGSPPCQAFSTAGKRHKGWGKEKKYEHGASQCNEQLFDEYIRILRGLMPKVFVAENVTGLVKGVAKGMFLEILSAMKDSGYRVKCKLLDAQWLGVPQARRRTIFIGVRNDLEMEPVYPKPLSYRYSVRDALPWILEIRQLDVYDESDRITSSGPSPTVTGQGLGAQRRSAITVKVESEMIIGNDAFNPIWGSLGSGPSPTIMAGGAHGGSGQIREKLINTVEPETDINRYAIGKEWDRLNPGEQSSKYFNLVKVDQDAPCPSICASHGNTSTAGVTHPIEKRKFTIAELRRICGFPDDFILTGSYAQQWERLGNSVPPVMMSHIAATIRDQMMERMEKLGYDCQPETKQLAAST